MMESPEHKASPMYKMGAAAGELDAPVAEDEDESSTWWIIVVILAVVCCCLLFGAMLMRKRKQEEEDKNIKVKDFQPVNELGDSAVAMKEMPAGSTEENDGMLGTVNAPQFGQHPYQDVQDADDPCGATRPVDPQTILLRGKPAPSRPHPRDGPPGHAQRHGQHDVEVTPSTTGSFAGRQYTGQSSQGRTPGQSRLSPPHRDPRDIMVHVEPAGTRSSFVAAGDMPARHVTTGSSSGLTHPDSMPRAVTGPGHRTGRVERQAPRGTTDGHGKRRHRSSTPGRHHSPHGSSGTGTPRSGSRSPGRRGESPGRRGESPGRRGESPRVSDAAGRSSFVGVDGGTPTATMTSQGGTPTYGEFDRARRSRGRQERPAVEGVGRGSPPGQALQFKQLQAPIRSGHI